MHELGETTAGVWLRKEALSVSTRGRLDAQKYDGAHRTIWNGTVTDGGHPMSPVQWAMAGVRASGGTLRDNLLDGESPANLGAVACGRDAARVWGIPLVDDDDPATAALDRHHHDVAVWQRMDELRSHPSSPSDPVDILHRYQLELARCDVVRHPSGLWLTVVLRTLYDLTALLSHEALVCALDFCLHNGLVSEQDLAALVVRVKGWRNAPAFRRATEDADRRAESPHETLTRLLLKPGWSGLTPQVPVFTESGVLLALLDLADEEIKLAVEGDGKRFHSGEVMWAKDKQRDRTTEAEGWRTERVTWFQVRAQGRTTRARILAIAERRRRALRRAA